MMVANIKGRIKIEAEYLEVAVIIQALDNYAEDNNDDLAKLLADKLRSPKVNIDF